MENLRHLFAVSLLVVVGIHALPRNGKFDSSSEESNEVLVSTAQVTAPGESNEIVVSDITGPTEDTTSLTTDDYDRLMNNIHLHDPDDRQLFRDLFAGEEQVTTPDYARKYPDKYRLIENLLDGAEWMSPQYFENDEGGHDGAIHVDDKPVSEELSEDNLKSDDLHKIEKLIDSFSNDTFFLSIESGDLERTSDDAAETDKEILELIQQLGALMYKRIYDNITGILLSGKKSFASTGSDGTEDGITEIVSNPFIKVTDHKIPEGTTLIATEKLNNDNVETKPTPTKTPQTITTEQAVTSGTIG